MLSAPANSVHKLFKAATAQQSTAVAPTSPASIVNPDLKLPPPSGSRDATPIAAGPSESGKPQETTGQKIGNGLREAMGAGVAILSPFGLGLNPAAQQELANKFDRLAVPPVDRMALRHDNRHKHRIATEMSDMLRSPALVSALTLPKPIRSPEAALAPLTGPRTGPVTDVVTDVTV